uniref:YLPM1 protein n=1 Tax=Homo sapiens TaxID=9606 RepID=Q6PJ41_HUMAN|nr:YLPM1 protein [Homo sapiens]
MIMILVLLSLGRRGSDGQTWKRRRMQIGKGP